MNFTENRYEQEMKEKPHPEPPAPARAPVGSRCIGCPYWRGIMCVSCYRDLLARIGR